MGGNIEIQGAGAGAVAGAQADRLAAGVTALAAGAKGSPEESAKVPGQFSKLLATMLVKEMRQALPEGFFGEGAGSDIFDGWLDEHLGTAIADRDGLHLENMIAHSLQIKQTAKETSTSTHPEKPEQGVRS